MSQLTEEISRRRTFAIISHPDAGKTTLTEKFLLYGGAIAQAGVVKGKKNSRAATSSTECVKSEYVPGRSTVIYFFPLRVNVPQAVATVFPVQFPVC